MTGFGIEVRSVHPAFTGGSVLEFLGFVKGLGRYA
jgi:hypothetical protein